MCPSKHQQHTWNHRKTQECASRATGPWGLRKERASTMADISGVVGMASGTCERQMRFCRGGWAKHDIDSSMERSCDEHAIRRSVSLFSEASTPRQCRWSILGNHCLFRVLCYEHWRDADIWLWQRADEISDFGPREYVSSGKFTGTRGHRLECLPS